MVGDEFKKVCKVFKFDSLNKHQEEALRFVFESKSDVFVNLLTGFGKSVVFRALYIFVFLSVDTTREKNILLVVSLLIKLIKTK